MTDLEPFLETIGREALEQIQLKKLEQMLLAVLPSNAFYRRKFEAASVSAADVKTMESLRRIPFTTKQELSADQAANPPYGTNLTWAPETYTRIHQTSGTAGEPLRWLDNRESWDWWGRCWAA